jgi:hypothetical protein
VPEKLTRRRIEFIFIRRDRGGNRMAGASR